MKTKADLDVSAQSAKCLASFAMPGITLTNSNARFTSPDASQRESFVVLGLNWVLKPPHIWQTGNDQVLTFVPQQSAEVGNPEASGQTDRQTNTLIAIISSLTNPNAFAVGVHVELAAARDSASLDHSLEMRHVLHVLIHVRRQYLHT